MKVHKNYPLKDLNAFHVNVYAKYFVRVKSRDSLIKILKDPKLSKEKKYVLGEGSSTFFTKDFDGLVLKLNFKGIKIVSENESEVVLEIGVSENWHELVLFAIKNNWAGIENMSLIPGTVGAAPVHNIAAYGQNFEDVFVSLDAVDMATGKLKTFDKKGLQFAYRESVFKKKLKNKFIIVKVRIKLEKATKTNLSYHSRYESLESELKNFAKPPYTLADISKAVINIRSRKFPDWKIHGNTGSYFKNPVVTKSQLKKILKKYPGVQYYPVDKLTYPNPDDPAFDHSNHVKVAAGWLLDEIGWKGKRIGNVGTSPNQAMVIVNYGGANAGEILAFAEKMSSDFKKHFGVNLEPEVNII